VRLRLGARGVDFPYENILNTKLLSAVLRWIQSLSKQKTN